MAQEDLDVIAERSYSVENDPTNVVVVRIGRPQPYQDQKDWFCILELSGPAGRRRTEVGGIDAIQALQGVLRMAGIQVAETNRNLDGRLRREGFDDGDLGW